MTSGPMRNLPIAPKCAALASRWAPTRPFRLYVQRRSRSSSPGSPNLRQVLPKRHLAQVRLEPITEVWFTAAPPRCGPAEDLLGPQRPGDNGDHKPPDERLIKLGKSTRGLYKQSCYLAVLNTDHLA